MAQNRIIRGIVLDSLSHAPLPNVSVNGSNSTRGSLTDAGGKFSISVPPGTKKLLFSATGYHASFALIHDTSEHPLRVFLSKSFTTLKDVVVMGKRGKYRNKNNPAVELIRQVIANKEKNAPAFYPHMTFSQYEKTRIMVDRLPKIITNNAFLKKYKFLFEHPDTTLIPGKSLVPLYIEERTSKNYHRTDPSGDKKIILGQKRVDFGEYIDMSGLSGILNRMYEDFNIYDNTMPVFTMQFLSPVAGSAPTFYMYFIRDTITEGDMKLVHLYFTPRNPEDLLFRGNMYITLDGSYAIRRVDLEVSKNINLNWVRNFQVTQEFEKGPGARYYRSRSDVVTFFSPLPKSRGFFGERTVSISNVSDSTFPDLVFRGLPVDTTLQSVPQPDSFWTKERPSPLSVSEARTYTNTDSLLKMRSYHNLMDMMTLLTAGYKSAGKFDIGPVGNFYGFNSLEGQKLRFGGRSNSKLSTRIFTDDYIAYGTKDQRWKYFVSGTYSLNHKSVYTYPFHYITASFLHDTKNPGDETVFAQGNTFLSSFSHGVGGKWLYNDIFRLSYIREFGDHYSYNLGFKYWRQQPAQALAYVYEHSPPQLDSVNEIKTAEFSTTLRWAPREQFYQGKAQRSNIINQYPIFTFQYTRGVKGLFNGQYNYDAFHFNIYKRWYVAPFGFSDISFDAGYLAGNLPFPLLIIHSANTSYYYSSNNYNLMNVAEFVSDHYAGVNIDHYFNGFFFNKIPLVKKLRLREVIAAKILYGGVRSENNPALNPQQMKFPLTNGVLSTYVLNGQPYLEASVGIYNIFSLLRIDLVKRFTYLDHPNISTMGLRFSTNIIF
jgi:uncharacterized protein DUF5686/carboxypeptidase-like protein